MTYEAASSAIQAVRSRITNTAVRDLVIALLLGFLSGTFAAAVPLYFLAQHEPKELFSLRELMSLPYAPLWITLAAVRFGPSSSQ